MSTDEKGLGGKTKGWIDRLIEKDERREGQRARRKHLRWFLRPLVVTDLKSVAKKTNDCQNRLRLTMLHSKLT